MTINRKPWSLSPAARKALAGISDEQLGAMSREQLRALPGVGERTADAILASLAPAGEGGVAETAPRSLAAPPSLASAPRDGLPPAAYFPAAAQIFPLIYEAGDRVYAQKRAAEIAADLGAGDALVAEHALGMLRDFWRSGRMVRAAYSEIASPTPSPFNRTEPKPVEG
jgi:hypothetical protein